MGFETYLKSFQNIEPTLRWRPDRVQGMPVARDTRRLAEVRPIWRLQLQPPRFIGFSSRAQRAGRQGLTSPLSRADPRASRLTRRSISCRRRSSVTIRVAEVSELDLQIEDGQVRAHRAKVKVSFKYEGGEERGRQAPAPHVVHRRGWGDE